MYFGGFLVRGRRSFGTWLAFRSTFTAASTLIAAWIVQRTALPALTRESAGTSASSSGLANVVLALRDWLIWLPLPGLLLGVAAIVLTTVRGPLALLAALAAFAAVAALVAVLVFSLAPLYQVPPDLLGK